MSDPSYRRNGILKAAMASVGRNEETYGSPERNLQTTADLWAAVGFLVNGSKPTGKDVAMAMVLLKVAREMGGKTKEDNFVDIAGYAAIAGEVAVGQAESSPRDDVKQTGSGSRDDDMQSLPLPLGQLQNAWVPKESEGSTDGRRKLDTERDLKEIVY